MIGLFCIWSVKLRYGVGLYVLLAKTICWHYMLWNEMRANKKNRMGGEFEMRKDDPFDEAMKVASSSECTGLMPALPATEQEDVNIAALYAIHKAKEKKKKK